MNGKCMIFLICALLAEIYAQTSDGVGPQPHSTDVPPTSTAPTTTKPTTKPTTTKTTSIPTSSIPTTSTSTTTIKPPTTTAPTPTPPVNPPVNNFTFNYTNTAVICFMLRGAIQVEVLGKNASMNSTKINIPKNTLSYANCTPNATTENVTISWNNNNVQLGFSETQAKKYEFDWAYITLELSGNKSTLIFDKPAFSARISESYKCAKDQTIELTALDGNKTVALLHVSDLQFQAFMNTTKDQFDAAWDCSGMNTPDVVPIVVGCVLAILVVLVLVAYLFGRRRCQARGYLSM